MTQGLDRDGLAGRAEAVQASLAASVAELAEARRRLAEIQGRARAGRLARQPQHEAAMTRLAARLASMPVIEQAKGVLIAQAGVGPDEALALLRSAARRWHVPLPELARRVVAQAAAGQRAEVLPPDPA